MLWFARIVALAAVVIVSGCKDPTLGRAAAAEHFHASRAGFQRIVEQVELCHPPTGRIDPQGDFECTTSAGDSRELLEAMRQVRARWIRVYYPRGDNETPPDRVQIAIHSYGTSYAGEIEAFVYEAQAAEQAEYESSDDGLAIVEREPLTDTPHHWYWWRIAR